MYGPGVKEPGTFAHNCLLARRLAERGVGFTQLMHAGWDQHNSLTTEFYTQCRDTDQASAALVMDLKQRGMLDDTLVIWGGEFGRTIYCQGKLTDKVYGRDHHPNCFTYWMAGGGIRGGMSYGETDDYSVNVVENPVHVHDLQATILNQMGIDHERLTYRYQGRYFRLTDVHGKVINSILA
jgi:arylsulfatase A-like enzyme